ncbi:MAG: hypothetical protein R3C11_25600 [Planctomycetaceae bacterium]
MRDAVPLLQIPDSDLVLENLDILVLPARGSTSGETPLFQLDGGELCLKSVSITSLASSKSTLIEMDSTSSKPNHVIVEDAVLRGEAIQVTRGMGFADEVILVNSLCSNKSVPLFSLANGSNSAVDESSRPASNLQFISCNLLSGDCCLEIPSAAAHEFRIHSSKNLFSASRDESRLVKSSVQIQPLKMSSEDIPDSLKMRWSEKGSCFTGWSDLLYFNDNTTAPIQTVEQWNLFWDQAVSKTQIFPDHWSEAAGNLLGSAALFIKPEFLGTLVEGVGGNGVWKSVPTGDELYTIYHEQLADRFGEQFPIEPFEPIVERFKLPDEGDKFVQRLNSDEWKNNTHFLLTGTGGSDQLFEVELNPVSVAGKNISIEFKPGRSGQAVRFHPLATNSDSPWIRVDGGDIRILNIAFELRSARNGDVPSAVLEVVDGGFIFEHCIVDAGFKETASGEGPNSIVHWVESETVEKEIRTGRIIDTFSCAFAPMVDSSVEHSRLQIHNSCLISGNSVVKQQILQEHLSPFCQNLWSNSSFSCWSQYLQIENKRNKPLDRNAMELELFHVYLGPSFLEKAKIPQLVQFSGNMAAEPCLRVTSDHVGVNDAVLPSFYTKTKDENTAAESSQNISLALTGKLDPIKDGTGVVSELYLQQPMPDKMPKTVSPLYLSINQEQAAKDADDKPLYGADLEHLPSLIGGQKSTYSRSTKSKEDSRNTSPRPRKIEF